MKKITMSKTKSQKANDAMRQSLLVGLGLLDLTVTKVEKYLSELKKDLPAKDRKQAAQEFIKSVKSNSQALEHSVRKSLKKSLDEMSAAVDPGKRRSA